MSQEEYCEVHLTLNSWQDAFGLAMEFADFKKNWIFRGQSNEWPLDSGLRRALDMLGEQKNHLDAERQVLSHFRDNAHLFDPLLPKDVGNFEWAARMQHYGGPSRLLDFTRSFWVAAFFALELNSARKVEKPLVWAVEGCTLYEAVKKRMDGDGLWEDVDSGLRKDKREFDDRLYSDKMRASRLICGRSIWGDGSEPEPKQHDLALYVESGWTDKRIVAQSAAFICPLSVDRTVAECVVSSLPGLHEAISFEKEFGPYDPLGHPKPNVLMRCYDGRSPALVKAFLPVDEQKKGLNMLEKMNITSATLFPGMDGLARSLYTHLTR